MDLAIATQPDPAAVRPGVRAAAVIHNCNLNFHNFFRFVSVRQKLKVPAFAKSHVYALFSWCNYRKWGTNGLKVAGAQQLKSRARNLV